MKKGLLAVLLASSLLFASNDSNSLSLGISTVKFDYTETNPQGVMLDTEKSDMLGKMKGIRVEYNPKLSVNSSDTLMLKMKYSLDRGNTEYKGSLIGSGQGYGSYTSKTLNTVHDLSVAIDETRQIGSLDVGLNVGVGYRYWSRELSSSQKEDYKWMYWKVGGQIGYDLTPALNIAVNGSYKRAISPKMKAYGSNSPISDTFNLGDTDGYSFGVPVKYEINKQMFVKTEYSYDYWKIAKSNVISGYYEPDSKTKNQTITVSLGYKW